MNQFLTEKDREDLLANGKRQDGEQDFAPVVKLFLTGSAATWLLSELDPEDPDIAFGLFDLGHGFPELGSVRLSELAAARNKIGLGVEKDRHFEAEGSVGAYARLAAELGYIVDRLDKDR